PDVDDVQRPRALGDEVRPRQLGRRFRKRAARAVDETAALHAELARERRQREHRADATAAVLVALEAVADGDRRRRDRAEPLRELLDVARVEAALAGGGGERPRPRERHVLVVPGDVTLDERAIDPAAPLELGGDRPRE